MAPTLEDILEEHRRRGRNHPFVWWDHKPGLDEIIEETKRKIRERFEQETQP